MRRDETTEEESPEDIRQRNVKEAEILASNMGEAGISAHEILSNVGQLKKLAQLHESMVSLTYKNLVPGLVKMVKLNRACWRTHLDILIVKSEQFDPY